MFTDKLQMNYYFQTLNIKDRYLCFLLLIQNYIQTTDIQMQNENAFLSIQKLNTYIGNFYSLKYVINSQ